MTAANRYATQSSLPEIGPAQQDKLRHAKIILIGAGGLGAAVLPYLAGAGIGQITIIDHDLIALQNLHRQTIYRTDQLGQSKALCAAAYATALNPEIKILPVAEKFTTHNAEALCRNHDLILDCSDNFETKLLLNKTSLQTKIPLLSASVENFEATIGLFNGPFYNAPCYNCLFPEIPENACNCNEAGILGTSAGLAGLYQAHVALCFLLEIGNVTPGLLLSVNVKNFRLQALHIEKNKSCLQCREQNFLQQGKKIMKSIPLRLPADVRADHALIIDVRTKDEIKADPIDGAMHIPLDTIQDRYHELPRDKLLAFACAANIRSMRAAEFMRDMGYDNICVMDRLS